MSRLNVAAVALVFAALVPACAHPEGNTTPNCPDRQASPPASSGGLDPGIARAATTAQGVAKLEVELGPNGEIEAVALYHMDESQVPEEVRRLASERFPGHTVRQYELEQTAGGPEIEVELTTSDGRTCEVAGRPDGTFLYQECEIPPAELPAAVRQTAEGAVPGATIREVEKREGGANGELYRIEMEASGAQHYLVVTAAGEVQTHSRVIAGEFQLRLR